MLKKLIDAASKGNKTLGFFSQTYRSHMQNLTRLPLQELITQRVEKFHAWKTDPSSCPGYKQSRIQLPISEQDKKNERNAATALNKLVAGYTEEGSPLYGPYYHTTNSLVMLDSICRDEALRANPAQYGARAFAHLVNSTEQLVTLLTDKPGVLFFTDKPLEIHTGSGEVKSEFNENGVNIHIIATWDMKQWRANEDCPLVQTPEDASRSSKEFK